MNYGSLYPLYIYSMHVWRFTVYYTLIYRHIQMPEEYP